MKERTYYKSNAQEIQGIYENLQKTAEGYQVVSKENETSIFASDVFDCGETAGTWDELHLHFNVDCNSNTFIWMFDMEEEGALLVTFSCIDRFYAIQQQGFSSINKDILLYSDKINRRGRYLCFAIELESKHKENLFFNGFEISFPAIYFSSYLPVVFQNDELLENYLSVFKDVYLELEEEIDCFHEQLDLETCDSKNINELLEWIGVERFTQYCERSKLRILLSHWENEQYQKGTWKFYYHLFRFLFDIDLHVEKKDGVLWVYLPHRNVQKEKQMLLFFKQEFPFFIHYKVQFCAAVYFDYFAYYDCTAFLQDKRIYYEDMRMNLGFYFD